MVDPPKALAIPRWPKWLLILSFYVIFTSTHDDLVDMTRHGRWIITNGSSDQCNGWLQLKTNAFIESNGWLFKSHCHSTLAKMVAYQWELIREGCKKKTSLLMDNSIMENIWWGPDWPTKEWLWIFHQYIATQALQLACVHIKLLFLPPFLFCQLSLVQALSQWLVTLLFSNILPALNNTLSMAVFTKLAPSVF